MHLLIVAGAAAEAVGGQDKVSPVARAKAKGLARGILVADYTQAIPTLVRSIEFDNRDMGRFIALSGSSSSSRLREIRKQMVSFSNQRYEG